MKGWGPITMKLAAAALGLFCLCVVITWRIEANLRSPVGHSAAAPALPDLPAAPGEHGEAGKIPQQVQFEPVPAPPPPPRVRPIQIEPLQTLSSAPPPPRPRATGPAAIRTAYDFEDQAPVKPIVIQETYLMGDETIERYPNIEAPDTVSPGQEIAVQVSLTNDQLAPETKILSGAQSGGKLQLRMAAGEDQWNITVNLTAPGMEFTRGGNTSEISITRKTDSTLAIFYLRPEATAEPRRETRILATLLHDGAFLARLSRPLTIVASTAQPAAAVNTAPAQTPRAAAALAATAPQLVPVAASATSKPMIALNPDLFAPDLTIVENRVGNTLRMVFFSPYTAPVEADIADPDALHAWIEAHYARMARPGRGIAVEGEESPASAQHAADYVSGFGSELYDRFAPQAFKDLFWKLMDNALNRSPENPAAHWRFESIQVLSDDPAIPWELMRPARADGSGRMDFLGLHFSMARWPMGPHGAARPPQSLALRQSAVIAPAYGGAQQLAGAGDEITTLKGMAGFAQVTGNYATVRGLAMHPPQGIIHFAGHGAIREEGGVPQFAILLEDSEIDPATWQTLEPSDVQTHPLYFFNACDVGESRRFMNEVDGWAPVLLASGASGYIGALWPVNDATAEAVAASFYHQISGHMSSTGSNVAEALAIARKDVFARTSDPTALAYVFYGDPSFVLTAAN